MPTPKPPNPGYQNWATPDEFVEWCEAYVLPVYGARRFTLDTCAEFTNRKCTDWFCAPDYEGAEFGLLGRDGLSQDWKTEGAVWCNPPYRKCAEWTGKAARQAIIHEQISCVLTHHAHSTGWYRESFKHCIACWLINPRINFIPPPGVKASKNPKDSILWVFGPEKLKRRGESPIIFPAPWRSDEKDGRSAA